MNTRKPTRRLSLLVLSIVTFFSPLVSIAKEVKEAVKPYPLTVCIVTDNDLGSMGDERRFVYEGQEIKICCQPCERKFLKNPKTYLKKLVSKKSE